MATQITSDNFEEYFLRTQAHHSDSLEQEEGARGAQVVTDLDAMRRTLVIPGVRYDQDPIDHPGATAEEYVQVPYSLMADQLDDMQQATQDAEDAAGSVLQALDTADADHTRAEGDHATAQGDHTTAQGDHTTAQGDHATAQGDHTTAQGDHTVASADHAAAATDHATAGTDHARAETDHGKVAGAENLQATLVGMTVTITNRAGVSTSTNIGFEITPDHVYASKAAMLADAANVPAGRFCMIASSDPADPDNATLWSRNTSAPTSQNPFTFLSDLDQASAAAWADWLENQKPAIQQATADANTAAANANAKAALADQKAGAAETAAGAADQKAAYAQAQGDRAKGYNDHPWEIRDDGYIWVWDETSQAMARTEKMIVGWNDMTAAQQASIVEAIKEDLIFATDETCEDIIDELT